MAERRSVPGRKQNEEKKKPRVDYEPCSAHGYTVNKLRERKEEREKETLALGPRVPKLTYGSILIG